MHESAGSADAQLGHLHFAFGDRLLVSSRRRPPTSVEKARTLIEQGMRVPAPVALLETIVQHVVAAIAEVVATLTREIDVIEEHTLSEGVRDGRRPLMPFRRTALRLHRQLCGLSTIFRRFEAVEPEALPPDLTRTAARLAQWIDALNHEVHAIQQRARLLQDEISQKLAAQTNRHLYALSVLSQPRYCRRPW